MTYKSELRDLDFLLYQHAGVAEGPCIFGYHSRRPDMRAVLIERHGVIGDEICVRCQEIHHKDCWD